MTPVQKLKALRALMKQQKIAAYYVPSADSHMSEYLPEDAKRRAWLSGFTGSAGELLVGLRKAGLWTDGRYYYQGAMQLEGSTIDLMKQGLPETPSMTAWLVKQLKKGEALGIDPTLMSMAQAHNLETALAPHGIKVKAIATNLIDKIWKDRPDSSLAPVEVHPTKFAGENVKSKLARVRAAMADAGCKAHVVGALDAVAWLLNIRAADILYTPVVVSYVVLTDKSCTLYVDARKVTGAVLDHLARLAIVKDYREVGPDLRALAKKKPRVWLDPAATNRWVEGKLRGCEIHEAPTPIMAMKAVKNAKQVAGITAAHVRDGVAMVKFLKWLEGAVPAGGVTEISAAERLRAFRAEAKEFRDLSFDTISGYAGNGSIIHYSADEKSNAKLKPRGLYLIDSGGQYPDGTTDITRTVALGRSDGPGKPGKRMMECFTRVLTGTIDCTMTPFPLGTVGRRIEMFARRNLWLAGIDYAHGTGHGVGQYLGVHEGPHSLKDLDTPGLVEGNLFSIEPGCYENGKFGIRCENLAFTVRDAKLSTEERTWLRFDTITLCPFDRSLIEVKLMTADQRAWLNAYHKRVYRELGPLLDAEHKSWLRRATAAI